MVRLKTKKNNIGFVCGILGLVFGWIPILGFIFPIIAISDKGKDEYAKTGRQLGWIGLACNLVASIIILVL